MLAFLATIRPKNCIWNSSQLDIIFVKIFFSSTGTVYRQGRISTSFYRQKAVSRRSDDYYTSHNSFGVL